VSTASTNPVEPAPVRRATLYARVWRWHFFAGLFVAPFACLLALSGSVYLFKPQIESALERRVDRDLARGPALPADALVGAALAQHPTTPASRSSSRSRIAAARSSGSSGPAGAWFRRWLPTRAPCRS
jgi:uncharacterized iron-regulated membrane protein